jgi:hypothetical protein
MVSEGVPGEAANLAMILVRVVSSVCENEVRLNSLL